MLASTGSFQVGGDVLARSADQMEPSRETTEFGKVFRHRTHLVEQRLGLRVQVDEQQGAPWLLRTNRLTVRPVSGGR